nr:MAG TPA: hypothetical protein [Caudoviricetes sp.]
MCGLLSFLYRYIKSLFYKKKNGTSNNRTLIF